MVSLELLSRLVKFPHENRLGWQLSLMTCIESTSQRSRRGHLDTVSPASRRAGVQTEISHFLPSCGGLLIHGFVLLSQQGEALKIA